MVKKIASVINKTISGLLIAIALIVIASSLFQKAQGVKIPMTFGFGYAQILTGSMEPTIPARSLIVIHKTDDISTGDIVTYLTDGQNWPVTHRIKAINGNVITTQGDANNATDPPMAKKHVVGKVVLVMPPTIIPFLLIGATVLIATSLIFSRNPKERTDNE